MDPTLSKISQKGPATVPDSFQAEDLATAKMRSTQVDDLSLDNLDATRIVDPLVAASGMSDPVTAPASLYKPKAGTVLGDFQLLEKLGEGAMGAVYRARQLSFDRIVALKILFQHVANNPQLVERLYREGRVLGQLDHENLVQAFGVGEVDGHHYVAMDFVEGHNLQRWLRRLGKFNVADALRITLAIARALGHAHGKGVIHRDIKPENILITPQGQVKVADLGMVKTDDEDMSLTQTGHALGTPWYMPLEQARNAKGTDGRSDIYALGCLLYCLLTGHPPFRGSTLVEVLQAKDQGTFATARSLNHEVPEKLDLILLKMAAKLPKHRYATCADLIRDLESLELAGTHLSFLGGNDTSSRVHEDTPLPPANRTIVDAPEFDTNIWFVKVPSSPGKHVIKKLTTEQIHAMFASGLLKPTVSASHFPKTGFRALSAYKEFGSVLGKITKDAADETTSKYRQLYKKIEDKEIERDEAQPKRVKTNVNAEYWLGMIWEFGKYPLAVVVVGGFIWWVVKGMF